jgi:transcriptional regulator with XRE-family HTH domain
MTDKPSEDLQLDASLLAHFMRVARTTRGWSLKEVAKKSGIAYEVLWRIETGRTKDTQISTAIAIAKAFGFNRKIIDLMDRSKPW